MKRAALYMRVSSLDQHPETQLLDLRQMAAQRGYEIAHEYTDRISGARARRPGLDDLMRDARRGRFDVVLPWASGRIVRLFLGILDELYRLRIEFVTFRGQIRAIAELYLKSPDFGRAILRTRPECPCAHRTPALPPCLPASTVLSVNVPG